RARRQHARRSDAPPGRLPPARFLKVRDLPGAWAQPGGRGLMAYLLDANVFIEAKNRYYGLDFCPAFWEWLIVSNASGLVFSIEKVADEIEAGGDDLAAWAAQRGPGFFLKPDTKMLPALGTVSTWATSQRYEPAAVNTFLLVADYYLVAHALAHGHTLVTHE